MTSSICASCLLRLRASSKLKLHSPSTSLLATKSFHTTAPQFDVVKKKSGPIQQKKFRESTSAKTKKKRREKPKLPEVGERKALRKRIVLSNTNALEIPGMEDMTPQNMTDVGHIGQMLGLEGALLDQLREAKAFKPTQNWNMFRRPATLVRKETVALGINVQEVNDSSNGEGTGAGLGAMTLQQIIAGERSTGKSLLLLQAMSMAYLNNWVVLNVPEGMSSLLTAHPTVKLTCGNLAQEFTIGQSSYAPLPESEKSGQEQLYVQPQMTSNLLSRAAYSNEKVLSRLKVSHRHKIPGESIKAGTSLRDLALIGARDQNLAWPVWKAFWKELTQPADTTKSRPPPVLIAIDGLDHWMGPSKYRSAEFELIHAHQLVLVREFVSMLFCRPSASNLANGGMILAATSGSNSPNFPDFRLLLRQLSARASGLDVTDQDFPMPEPYRKVDQRVLNMLGGSEETTIRTLRGLSRNEARGLLEYFARSGVLKENITEDTVGEKWTLSGGGVIGEMANLGKRVRV